MTDITEKKLFLSLGKYIILILVTIVSLFQLWSISSVVNIITQSSQQLLSFASYLIHSTVVNQEVYPVTNPPEESGSVIAAGTDDEQSQHQSFVNSCYLDKDKIVQETSPQKIIAPSINLDLFIEVIPYLNSSWQIKPLVANLLSGYVLPNSQTGNTALFGSQHENVFLYLSQLKEGQEIFLLTPVYDFVYKVYDAWQVKPGQLAVLQPSTEPILTLVSYKNNFVHAQYVVKAKLDRIEIANCDKMNSD